MPLFLLDTDILSEILKQRDPVVVRRASTYVRQQQRFAFSAMTRYEVVRGLKDKGGPAATALRSLLRALLDHPGRIGPP